MSVQFGEKLRQLSWWNMYGNMSSLRYVYRSSCTRLYGEQKGVVCNGRQKKT